MKQIITIVLLMCAANVTFLYDIAVAANAREKVVLPKGYSNDDIVQLYKYLRKKYPPREDDEKKDAYLKRIQEPLQKNKYTFASAAYPDMKGYIYGRYDTTQEILRIGKVIDDEGLMIKRIKQKEYDYVAQNIFGAKVIVHGISEDYYGIYAINSEDLNNFIFIKMSSEERTELKNNFGVLFVCELKKIGEKGYTKQTVGTKQATFTSPISRSFLKKYIYVEVTEVVVYNKKTGEVYAKNQYEQKFGHYIP